MRFVVFFMGDSTVFSRYREMMNMLRESAEYACPGARFTFLTDSDNAELPGFQVQRFTPDPNYGIMANRLMAYRQFCLGTEWDQDATVLLDPDILIGRDPETLFARPFDIGLCHRVHKTPIQGGTVLVFPGRREHALRFFSRCLDELRNTPSLAHSFVCDQLIYAKIVGALPVHDAVQYVRVEEFLLQLIPQSPKFHAYPKYKTEWNKAVNHGAYFLHFKGARKAYMAEYFIRLQMERRTLVPLKEKA